MTIKSKTKLITLFSYYTLVLLVIVFIVHLFFLKINNFPLFANRIIESYLINGLLAIAIYAGLLFLKKKYFEQLGYLYMVGSFLKFSFFFIFFYPFYRADKVITKLEFSTFYIPYGVSLVLETYMLIKLLKTKDTRKKP